MYRYYGGDGDRRRQREAAEVETRLDDCHAQLEEAQQQIETLQDKYLRAAAQADNVRKRTERDMQARATADRRELLRQLLDVIDNLERALAQPAQTDVLRQGVQLTHRQLEGVLRRAGAERIGVEPGDPFNPEVHEAVEVRRGQSDEPTVTTVVQPGYLYGNVLLRPARVVVTQ